ncbi:hypothetical protein GGE09_000684 [Roseobacter sp. N2S]|nr:hypothetical protein [Roseobacter sp. N2S]
MRVFIICLSLAVGLSACGIKDDPLPVSETSE